MSRNCHHSYIRQRSNGIWYADFYLGKRRVCFSLNTANETTALRLRDRFISPLKTEFDEFTIARNLLMVYREASDRLQHRIDQVFAEFGCAIGDSTRAKKTTMTVLCADYVAYLKISDMETGTVRKIEETLTGFMSVVGSEADPETVTTDDVIGYRDFLASMPPHWQAMDAADRRLKTKKLSATTVNMCVQTVRSLFRWAIDEQRLGRQDIPGRNVKIRNVRKNHKRPPTADECAALAALPYRKNAHFDAFAWLYMPLMARYTGMRIGEIAQLDWRDLRTVDGIAVIDVNARSGKKIKTSTSARLIPVADRLSDYIDKMREDGGNGRIFRKCGDYTDRYGVFRPAYNLYKTWNRRAKSVAPDLSMHCWRVYANNAMVSAGVDITDRERILGHRNSLTQSAYTPRDLARFKAAVDTIP